MSFSRRRAMTWTLIVLGVLVVGLGAALVATFPWSQNAAQATPGVAPGSGPGAGSWYWGGSWHGYAPWGHGPGWFFHGPRFFGGGRLIVLLLVVLVSVSAGRWRNRRHDERLDAEEILRRTFAEGRITEEEYQSRLNALRK